MTDSQTELFVTARGWSYPSWQGSFYPEDLPQDWRLSYFSNEFRAVVVPESEWMGEDPIEIERWMEDVSEEFLFYLEVENLHADWEYIAEFIKTISGQLGGFILRPQEIDADLAMISDNITAATKLADTCILLPEGIVPSEEGKNLLKQYGVQCGWNVGEGSPGWMDANYDSKLVVVRVAGNKNFTARQWRETIELAMRKGSISNLTILMIIDSDAPKINDLRTAMMIGDMMVAPTSLLKRQ